MQDFVGPDGDTVKLLRECDAGVKMGVESIDGVLDNVKDETFHGILSECKYEHQKIAAELGSLLDEHSDSGKSPNPVAKSMSRMKTNAKLMADPSDKTVADLMTDGCNMGVKSLSRYINQYKNADKKSKDLAERLVDIELQLTEDIRRYL